MATFQDCVEFITHQTQSFSRDAFEVAWLPDDPGEPSILITVRSGRLDLTIHVWRTGEIGMQYAVIGRDGRYGDAHFPILSTAGPNWKDDIVSIIALIRSDIESDG